MNLQAATPADFNPWLSLAREVESLFGPMVGEPAFHAALTAAIERQHAFCLRVEDGPPGVPLCGGILIDAAANEIAWLVVAERWQGHGYGRALLAHALNHLNPGQDISVTTFASTVPEGQAARQLYQRFGFADHHPGPPTPAGIPTAVMLRSGKLPDCV